MRLIYETPPVPGSFTDPLSARTMSGYASFRIYLVLPGEALPDLPTAAAARSQFRSLSELRAHAGGGPIVAELPNQSLLRGLLPDKVAVPEYVLESLPADALLRFSWGLSSGERGAPLR